MHYEAADGTVIVFDGQVYRRQDDGPDSEPLTEFNPAEYRVISGNHAHKLKGKGLNGSSGHARQDSVGAS